VPVARLAAAQAALEEEAKAVKMNGSSRGLNGIKKSRKNRLAK
jgi:hypothetical protein